MASTLKGLQKFNQLEQYTTREGACLATFGLDVVVQTVSSWHGDFTHFDYRTNVNEPVGNSLTPAVEMAGFGSQGDSVFVVGGERSAGGEAGGGGQKREAEAAMAAATPANSGEGGSLVSISKARGV
uniref:Uncharacterized protein n=1 Tax=Oryza nivara TaxID=4536 RepID=A0A0E0G574_ORYNI